MPPLPLYLSQEVLVSDRGEFACRFGIAIREWFTVFSLLDGGEFAHIYFIDWDHVRARHRQLNVTVMGTTEDVNDRKFHGGQTINTLRKYTDEEKAHDVHYTLQLDAREF